MIVNSKKIQFATLNVKTSTQEKPFFNDLKDVKNDYADKGPLNQEPWKIFDSLMIDQIV
jgi:hypothetical protein